MPTPANAPVDVLIIGAGASGGAVAWSLADTRMRILLWLASAVQAASSAHLRQPQQRPIAALAHGLRNSLALAVHAASNTLLQADNARDVISTHDRRLSVHPYHRAARPTQPVRSDHGTRIATLGFRTVLQSVVRQLLFALAMFAG